MRATLAALDKNKNIEVRLFNPFVYHGNITLFRKVEFALNAPRVNHRMHNKLMVVDGAVAVIGGRNVADAYFETGDLAIRFETSTLPQWAPSCPSCSESFDAYWNCALAIPQEALAPLSGNCRNPRPAQRSKRTATVPTATISPAVSTKVIRWQECSQDGRR